MYPTNTKNDTEGITRVCKSHFATPNEIIDSGNDYQSVLEALGGLLKRNWIFIRMCHCYSSDYFLIFKKKQEFTMRESGCQSP